MEIALSKMDGFVVTPRTQRVSTISASWPVWIRWRSRSSSQADTPASVRACMRALGVIWVGSSGRMDVL